MAAECVRVATGDLLFQNDSTNSTLGRTIVVLLCCCPNDSLSHHSVALSRLRVVHELVLQLDFRVVCPSVTFSLYSLY